MIQLQRGQGSLLPARRSPHADIHTIPSMAVFQRKPTNQRFRSVAAQNEAEAPDHVTDVICGLGVRCLTSVSLIGFCFTACVRVCFVHAALHGRAPVVTPVNAVVEAERH